MSGAFVVGETVGSPVPVSEYPVSGTAPAEAVGTARVPAPSWTVSVADGVLSADACGTGEVLFTVSGALIEPVGAGLACTVPGEL